MPENRLSTKDLKELISSGKADRLYLFYGPDEYQKDYYERALRKMIAGDDTFGFVKLSDNFSFDRLNDELTSIPMFGGSKFILVKDSKIFKSSSAISAENVESFRKMLSDIPEDVTLCFSESETDRRNAYFRTVIELAKTFESTVPEEDSLARLVINIAGKNGIRFNMDAADLLVEGIGNDTMILIRETEKLCMAAEKGVIDRRLVADCCNLSLHANIYQLTDALFSRDRAQAVKTAESLLEGGDSVQKLLVSLGSHFTRLYFAKDMSLKGKTADDIAYAFGNKPYYIKKLLNQCKDISLDRLKDDIDFCFKADCDIKSGELTDRDALDMLLLSC